MRNFLVLALIIGSIGGGFAAIQGDYAHLAREMQIQRTPSAEILKQHALHQASLERAEEQPMLPVDGRRRDEPVQFYFATTIS